MAQKNKSSFFLNMTSWVKYGFLAVFIFIFSASAFGASSKPWQSLNVKVVGVHDGDTITVLTPSKETIKVRLLGIDAPEKRQAFGEKATQALASLVFGKDVTVSFKERDRYGRILGLIKLSDGSSVDNQMLSLGYAWHYRHYSKDAAQDELEQKAREQKLGLWADAHPIAPWNFRHGGSDVSDAPKVDFISENRSPDLERQKKIVARLKPETISAVLSVMGQTYCRENPSAIAKDLNGQQVH